MGKQTIIVSVRMEKSDLRRLQLIAQIYGQSVGALIRTAIEKHTNAIARSKDFRTKAPKILERNEKMLEELFAAANAKEQ